MGRYGRWAMLLVSGGVLGISYQFRNLDIYRLLFSGGGSVSDVSVALVVNKVTRYLVNDLAALGIVYALFRESRYLHLAFGVMLFGLLVLLPVYLAGYFFVGSSVSILLQYLHRLVMSPVLVMLLVPAFFVNRKLLDKPVPEDKKS